MTAEPRWIRIVLMSVPTAAFLVCLALLLRFRGDHGPDEALASQRRVELVKQMEIDLLAASEAEKSSVLAVTDQESEAFADQARAASARVQDSQRELASLLTSPHAQHDVELLGRFTVAFADLQRIDKELLDLAVKNTNLKAYSLTFGPAAAAVDEMNAALGRVIGGRAGAPDAKTTMSLAFGAETSALHLQTLLPPHIAEEDDKKMDALEARMRDDDARVHQNLDALAALDPLKDNPDLRVATERYAAFSGTRTKILALSRENTNVRSLAISLNEKRKAMLACETALDALQASVSAESNGDAPNAGRRARPR